MTTDQDTEAAKGALKAAADSRGEINSGIAKIQKAIKCGYNYGARIMLHLETTKFISEPDSNGVRVLLSR